MQRFICLHLCQNTHTHTDTHTQKKNKKKQQQKSKGFDIQVMNANGDWKAAKRLSRSSSQTSSQKITALRDSVILVPCVVNRWAGGSLT